MCLTIRKHISTCGITNKVYQRLIDWSRALKMIENCPIDIIDKKKFISKKKKFLNDSFFNLPIEEQELICEHWKKSANRELSAKKLSFEDFLNELITDE